MSVPDGTLAYGPLIDGDGDGKPIVTRTTASLLEPQVETSETPSASAAVEKVSPPISSVDDIFRLDRIFSVGPDAEPASAVREDSVADTFDPTPAYESFPQGDGVSLTTLPSGMRVVTRPFIGSACATIGVLLDYGSRDERPGEEDGAGHLLEAVAFHSTENRTTAEVIAAVDAMGGAMFASVGRENAVYSLDVLRTNLDDAMSLLAECVLRPALQETELEGARTVLGFQMEEIPPYIKLMECINKAAYGPLKMDNGTIQTQELGRPHLCDAATAAKLDRTILQKFLARSVVPKNIVLAAAGLEHSETVALAQKYFEAPVTSSHTKASRTPSIYTGGKSIFPLPSPVNPAPLPTPTFVSISFPFLPSGWHDPNLIPACVLQQLLGGGSSFSAGGPGKGMYSRLYREVLNRYHWAESAEALTVVHDEHGLLGLIGSVLPTHGSNRAGDLVRIFAEQWARLATQDCTDEEVSRARNMLKCNVLTQLEGRLVQFEDVGRQVLTYGKREGPENLCRQIDAVDATTIRKMAEDMVINRKPTVAAVGLQDGGWEEAVPSAEEVEAWFCR